MRFNRAKLGMAIMALLIPSGAMAQPNDAAANAANADLAPITTVDPSASLPQSAAPATSAAAPVAAPSGQPETGGVPVQPQGGTVYTAPPAGTTAPASQTYSQQDVLARAEGVFGRGAEGLGGIIEKIFKENGEPNGYIVGREGGGALAIGLRYGSGTLFHKIEGEHPVYWTGPSVGFDIGADASKTFTLVYHLNDTEELFRRYPAVEGKVYFVGGFSGTYLQRGDIILVPIKLGVGWRLGANVGYLSFSKKSKILPF